MAKVNVILLTGLVVTVGVCGYIFKDELCGGGNVPTAGESQGKGDQKASSLEVGGSTNISDLHSDILRLIADGADVVCGVYPQEAAEELKNRAGRDEVQADKKSVNAKELPFGILRIMAKSPATIAGVKPQAAIKEIYKRFLSLDEGENDVNSKVLLKALQRRQNEKVIDNWASNEDAEAMDKYIKEEADNNKSSVANFVYGLKKLNDERESAIERMKSGVESIQGDSFDGQADDEQSAKELAEAVKSLK
jgi:hypothetical protein